MKQLKNILEIIQNPENDFDERVFLLFTVITEIAVFIVFIGDIIVREHPAEILTLGLTLIIHPILVYISMIKHRIDLGSKASACIVVFEVMPIVFFFGGGPDGGAIIWFIYSTIYVGVLLKGRMRVIMLSILFLTAAVDYYIAWTFPELIYPHSKGVYYVDSIFSVLAVSVFAYSLVRFQMEIFISENKRAKEEREKVRRLNESQNRFFSNMSHEIRTPINTILGLNEIILREDVSDEVREDAQNIQSAGKLLLTLINDILDKSKLESGQMQLVEDEYRMTDMLREVVLMLAPRAAEKHLKFDIKISPELPSTVRGDEVRISQILINVINNAIKYTNEGTVAFEAASGKTEGDRVNLVFSVRDTGIGIRKESLPHLFTAFKRVDGAETHHIEGTGLGLSIVSQLLDIMGGTISVNSIYTKGSTFVVEIPQRLVDETAIGTVDLLKDGREAEQEISYGVFTAPEARLLIVDDTEANLMVEKKLLRDTLVQVDVAKSGAEALARTMEKEYHIILMDHLMPEMDGIECAHRIRTQKGGLCKDAKIIALTANAGGEARKLFEEAGFDGYLTKPVSGEALEKEVARLLPVNLVSVEDRVGNILQDTVRWMSAPGKKRSVAITTESICDLPEELIAKYGIEVIPHKVITRDGRFRDGLEVESQALVKYMWETGDKPRTREPDVREHEEFFARTLLDAKTVIHITISGRVNHSGYRPAYEASTAFDNVYVFDSKSISSGQGLLVLAAARMAEEGMDAKEILTALDRIAKKVHSSFLVDDSAYLAYSGQVSHGLAHFFNSLTAKPVLVMREGKMGLGRVFFGSREHAREAYIMSETVRMRRADTRQLFITYGGMAQEDVLMVKKLVESRISFERIYTVQASGTVSANGGPESFGLFYFDR